MLPSYDLLLEDDDVIEVGRLRIRTIHTPGHTPGSMSFQIEGTPVLLTGDACHTAWGWEHGVGPGTFSDDVAKSAESLSRLEALVTRHPRIEVRLGHQQLPVASAGHR